MDFLQWRDVSHYRDEGRKVACPPEIELDFFCSTYFDVIFIEDFSRLRDGLIELRKAIRTQAAGPFHEDEDIEQWFRDVRKPDKEKNWRDFGYFDLSKISPRPSAVHKLHISASLLCSSAIVLYLSALPAKSFKERFTSVISQEVDVKVRLTRFNLFGRRNHPATRSVPLSVRHEQIEDLMLEMNKDVASLLRQYIQLGWSLSGPLPSVEQFLLRKGPYGLPSNRDFWSTLEMADPEEFHYSAPGVRIFSPGTFFKNRITEPFRILITKDEFPYNKTRQGYASEEFAIEHEVDRQCVSPLIDMLALKECSQRLARKIASLHELLAGFLSRRSSRKPFGVRGIRKAFAEMINLNQVVFECRRIEMETSSDNLADFVERLSHFVRRTRGKKEEGEIGEDLSWQIKNLRKYASEHLAILKENYKETLDYNLQRFGFLIAVLGVFLALFQFIPQEIKMMPFDWIINNLSHAISHLISESKTLGL